MLRADAASWCLHVLYRWPTACEVRAAALALLGSIGSQPAARAALLSPAAASSGAETCRASRCEECGGQQWLSSTLRERRAAAAGADKAPHVTLVRVHCGGDFAPRLKVLAEELSAALAERCACAQPPPPPVHLRRVGDGDARAALAAAAGVAVFAEKDCPAFALLGEYTAWACTRAEFEACVPAMQRADYDARCVTARSRLPCAAAPAKRRRRRSAVSSQRGERLLLCAYPASVAGPLAELCDWRALDAGGAPLAVGVGNGPSCLLLEVLHRGWPRLFVVTQRRVAAGDELTVQYPDAFWAGHAAAAAAQRDARAALGVL